jgi:cysteine synthase
VKTDLLLIPMSARWADMRAAAPAYVGAALGYRCIFTIPDVMTVERRHLLRALGCKVVLTEGAKGMKAAIARAEEIAAKLGDRAWIPRQFDDPANPAIHYGTTGPEIWEATGGRVDIFMAGVDTGERSAARDGFCARRSRPSTSSASSRLYCGGNSPTPAPRRVA